MARTKRDVKSVFLGRQSSSNFKPLTNADWKTIDDACSFPLTPKLQSQLNQATSLYVKCGPNSLDMVLAKQLQKWLISWTSKTRAFRKQISTEVRRQKPAKDGSTTARNPKKSQSKNNQRILDKYFSADLYSMTSPTTDDIAFMLDGATKLATNIDRRYATAQPLCNRCRALSRCRQRPKLLVLLRRPGRACERVLGHFYKPPWTISSALLGLLLTLKLPTLTSTTPPSLSLS